MTGATSSIHRVDNRPVAPVRVVLAGAHGHGRWHLDNLRRLAGSGLVRLVGVADVRPVPAEALTGLGEPEQSADLAGLVERTGAEITILATPIHTHAGLVEAAVQAGSHLLLEKPPAGSLADHERIVEAVRLSGRACQVGFQSLGSDAIPFLRKVIADGHLGRVRGIGVAGAWDRPAAYFTRASWAGRRRLDGLAVTDGALTNPFAHGVATALAVAEAEQFGAVAEIDVELFHANPIEADDTASARLRLATGTEITVAVTLCAPGRSEPSLIVHGEHGTARLNYTLDEVVIGDTSTRHARTDLLENLIAHVRTGAQLLVPLSRTGAFMQFVEAVRCAPDPIPIGAEHQLDGTANGRVLPGIEALTGRSARELALYSELAVPWAPAEQAIHAGDRQVAAYRWRPELPATVAPRPHLHPVRTLGGVVVSETGPADHVHHLGVGVAIADVGGTNFWGGRTYLPDLGPTWRGDHGRQRHLSFARRAPGGFVEHLEWLDPNGVAILGERREVAARVLDEPGCWELDFEFTLTNLTESPLAIRSSATKGRHGAGYGGFFWRAPGSTTQRWVFTAHADGEDRINGTQAPWVALGGLEWTLVFVQIGSSDPWFVRVNEYPGVGPALAWHQALELTGSMTRRVITVVADGRLDRERAEALATER
jgi:predicted dehydrogenase